jgi:hypothetical protein
MSVWFSNYSTSAALLAESSYPPNNSWVHYALVRNGNTFTLYRNGVSSTSATFAGAVTGTSNPNWIGTNGDGTQYSFNGYLSSFRIVNGTAVYTTNFTPAAAPNAAIPNTQLLCNFGNGNIVDRVMMNNLETVGDARISTSVVKYGTGSMAFDGSTGNLTAPYSPNYVFGTGDFTVEGWFYFNDLNTNLRGLVALGDGGNASGPIYNSWSLRYAGSEGSNQLQFNRYDGTDTTFQTTGVSLTASTWYHIAVCRAAGTLRIFVNGISYYSAANSVNYSAVNTNSLRVGLQYYGPQSGYGGPRYWNGYIADLRITKGVARYIYNFTPPAAISLYQTVIFPEAYSKYVILWLNGNSTNNGAQNNTFLDSSSNNFTITRNGNTTQGTFSPYGSNWSNAFPDSGSNASAYLSTTIAGALSTALAGASQTREFWWNRAMSGSSNTGLFRITGGDQGTIYCLSGNLIVYNGGAIISVSLATYVPYGVWTHIAVTQGSGTVTLWVNGVSVGTSSTTWSTTGSTLTLGGASDMLSCGYLSNVRVSNSVRYTTTFTPSTTPFTADANTILLCCQTNRFNDTSSTANALTTNGTPSVQRFSPFSPTAAYSTSVIGGSGYFDGTGDYLTVANNAAFNLGTGDFTIEFSVFSSGGGRNQSPVALYNPSTNGYCGTSIDTATGQFYFSITNDAGDLQTFSVNYIIPGWSTNQWFNLAVTRSGTTISLYSNGTRIGTATTSESLLPAPNVIVGGLHANYYGTPIQLFVGYLSNVRIIKGTALYTGSSYTVSTTPLTAVSGTSLLTNFTNGGIFDNAMMNNLETVGNARVSTSVAKYGTGAMYFDGTNSGLTHAPLAFGAGDLTVEWWSYQSAGLSYFSGDSVYSGEIISGNSTGALGIFFYSGSQSAATNIWVYIYNGATMFQLTINTTLNQWYHFALTRYSGTWRMFVNGTQVGTSTVNGTYNIVDNRYIGWRNTANFLNWFPGYIDDLRITKGVARYIYNFTPPSEITLYQQSTSIATATSVGDPYFPYTVMLLHSDGTNGAQNNTFLDSSANNFSITRNGNVTQGSFSPYGANWSNYLNNSSYINTQSTSGDYLSVSNNSAFDIGTGDFTLEVWINPAQMPTSDAWPTNWWQHSSLFGRGTPSVGDGFDLVLGATRLIFHNNDVQMASGIHNITIGNWYHVAACRNSGTLRLFVNGNIVATSSTAFTGGGGSNFYIGCETGEGAYFSGYMSNVRFVVGTALYTTTFTPSTTPLTAISGTSLLTCQSNRFRDNSTNAFAITVNGTPSVQRFSPFSPTAAYSTSVIGGSAYFDGSGDYLDLSSTITLSGDFTVEAWVYQTGDWGSGLYSILFYGNNNTQFTFDNANGGGTSRGTVGLYNGTGILSATTAIKRNTWNHVAWTRSGSTVTIYVNGTNVASGSAPGTTQVSRIGSYTSSYEYRGFVTSARVVNGVSVYTGNFTPPSLAPLTVAGATSAASYPSTININTTFAASSTQLLMNFDNSAIFDNAMMNDLETVGNAQISTTQSKFGGSSIYIPADTSTVKTKPNDNKFAFNTGAWTVEGWFYVSSASPNGWLFVASQDPYTSDAGSFGWGIGYNIGGTNSKFTLTINNAGSQLGPTSTNTFATATWYHVAGTYDGSTLRLFVNGNLEGSTSGSYNITPSGLNVFVGWAPIGGVRISGYFDDLRITKGYARYTSNFTPPTAAFPNQ